MWYNEGDLIKVRVHGAIVHEGIMAEDGRVISNSRRRGGVFEEPFRDFSGGRKVVLAKPLSNLSSSVVLANARARIGQTYHPSKYNCEHFVRECYGLKAKSPQKALFAGVAAAALALFAFT
jgi:hypothetical protein